MNHQATLVVPRGALFLVASITLAQPPGPRATDGFDLVEATIADVHAAMRSGSLPTLAKLYCGHSQVGAGNSFRQASQSLR